MKKKKIAVFIFTLICLMSFPLSAYAEEYGTDYPSYIQYSGGAYCEVQSSIGRGAFILQDIYKSGYIGFYGNSYNLCNLSNSTLTGRFVLQNGTIYQFRFSAYSIPQYYYESGMTREWRDVTISKIYNTNIELIDNTNLERNNLIDVFDYNIFYYSVIGAFFIVIVLLVVITLVLKGR